MGRMSVNYVLVHRPLERNGWFPLIARAASPQALLSFRYTVRILKGAFHLRRLKAGR